MNPRAQSISLSASFHSVDADVTAEEDEALETLVEDENMADVFRDLNPRSRVFRSRLIEEFRLLDGARLDHSSSDMKDAAMMEKILTTRGPNEMIDFCIHRRGQQMGNVDRRDTRVKAKDSVSLDLWAKWVLDSSVFQNFILTLVLLTSITSGLSAELQDKENEYHMLFVGLNVFDYITTTTFIAEIILKWIDNFWNFWIDGWNLLDFVATAISTAPLIMEQFSTSNISVLQSFQSLRMLRVLRALKLVLRFGSLKIIVLTVIEAFKSLALIMILIGIFMYIFAVLALYLFDEYATSTVPGLLYQDEFNNLGPNLAMLFQFITMDNWGQVTDDLNIITNPITTYLWSFIWIWLGGFILRSIFVGVMVSNFDKLDKVMTKKKEAYIKEKKFKKLRQRLNMELELQNNMKQSIQNIQGAVNEVSNSVKNLTSLGDLTLTTHQPSTNTEISSFPMTTWSTPDHSQLPYSTGLAPQIYSPIPLPPTQSLIKPSSPISIHLTHSLDLAGLNSSLISDSNSIDSFNNNNNNNNNENSESIDNLRELITTQRNRSPSLLPLAPTSCFGSRQDVRQSNQISNNGAFSDSRGLLTTSQSPNRTSISPSRIGITSFTSPSQDALVPSESTGIYPSEQPLTTEITMTALQPFGNIQPLSSNGNPELHSTTSLQPTTPPSLSASQSQLKINGGYSLFVTNLLRGPPTNNNAINGSTPGLAPINFDNLVRNAERQGSGDEPFNITGLDLNEGSARITQTIQQILCSNDSNWKGIVDETLIALGADPGETMWPRDTLFRYLQLMESLQENIQEYHELQGMAAGHLLQMFDD